MDRYKSINLAIILVAAITLTLAIPYANQLWHAPLWGSDVYPTRGSLIATYGIPPLVTILVAVGDFVLYHRQRVSGVYGIYVASIMTVGWLVTTIIWGHCHIDAGVKAINPWFTVCYQMKVEPSYYDTERGRLTGLFLQGVSQGLGYAMTLFSSITLFAYVVYLAVSIVDVARTRRASN